MALTFEHIARARGRVIHDEGPAHEPAILRTHMSGYTDVTRARFDLMNQHQTLLGLHDAPLFGLDMEAADYYRPGVWRLLTREGDLLHDPREGMTLGAIREGRWPGGLAGG